MVLKFNAHLVKCRLKYGLCNPPLRIIQKIQKLVEIHFMLIINSPDCSTCLFNWYWLLLMPGGVGGDFSQAPKFHSFPVNHNVHETPVVPLPP